MMQPWEPITNVRLLKRIGKTIEELGELTSALSRCMIQGVYAAEPITGKINIQWLAEEVADVQAQLNCTVATFGLNEEYIKCRVDTKMRMMNAWEAALGPIDLAAAPAPADPPADQLP